MVADAVRWSQVILVLIRLVMVSIVISSHNIVISPYLGGQPRWCLMSLLHLDPLPGRLLLVLQVQLSLAQLLVLLVLLLDVPVHVPAQCTMYMSD